MIERSGGIFPFLSTYDACSILTPDDWECTCPTRAFCPYDTSESFGRFGVSDGEFFAHPLPKSKRLVSRLKWNMARCEQVIRSEDRAELGVLSCIVEIE